MKRFITPLFLCFFVSPLLLTAQLPAGSIAKYQLNNTAVDIGGDGYDGTLNSTTATTNRFYVANSATDFVSGSSNGTLPAGLVTAMASNFSIGFWFNTTMIANSSSQWYGGNSLVDAEVCGGTVDWGTALVDGGKVSMGTGSPDLTIKSALDYNDGAWHFVTGTRDMAAGTITLYVDGMQVASTGGTTMLALTAPSFLGLATNPCSGAAAYTGSLDDIIVYDRVLSSTEVTALYNYSNLTVLPLQWISWNGAVKGNAIGLQWQTANEINNDHFEIEHSTDGSSFLVIGTVAAGNGAYTFTDTNPAKGNNFYRIRQVDQDGKYTRSSTIKLTYLSGASDIYLQTNPVAGELVLVNSHQIVIQQILITDLSGRIVSEQALQLNNAVIKVPVQKLRPGYYLARISVPGSNSTIRFLKQ